MLLKAEQYLCGENIYWREQGPTLANRAFDVLSFPGARHSLMSKTVAKARASLLKLSWPAPALQQVMECTVNRPTATEERFKELIERHIENTISEKGMHPISKKSVDYIDIVI